MLEVNQLTRDYGRSRAVNAVSFSIKKGEIVGLLGHNGAGKTTIMKILSGFLEPSAGQVVLNGKLLSQHTKDLQQKIGYLPESLPVYPEMIVADYLDYAAELKGLRGNAKARDIKRVVLATDIADKILAPIATLSRGYKQRVGVAQAILGSPELLILDEPTNGLDPTQTLLMRELIRQLAKQATIILSTHIMQEVDALCDRVLMMRAGELVVDAKLADLQQGHSLRVVTDQDATRLMHLLQPLEGIAAINSVAGREPGCVSIQLAATADVSQLSAQVAVCLVNAKVALYHLAPETHNLESLFREVNDQVSTAKEAIQHAA